MSDETSQQARIRGASDVLTKPYEVSEVLEVVERVLRGRLRRT